MRSSGWSFLGAQRRMRSMISAIDCRPASALTKRKSGTLSEQEQGLADLDTVASRVDECRLSALGFSIRRSGDDRQDLACRLVIKSERAGVRLRFALLWDGLGCSGLLRFAPLRARERGSEEVEGEASQLLARRTQYVGACGWSLGEGRGGWATTDG